jgi:PAS domain S-box-containing protein
MEAPEASRYATFFEVSPEMMFISGMDCSFKDSNPATEKLTGFTRAQLLGTRLQDRVPPEGRPEAEAFLERVRAHGSASLDLRFVCSGGAVKWLALGCVRSGGLIYGTARDITIGQTTRTALLESEATMRRILDLAPMSMAIVSMAGTIEYINHKAEETFGYPHKDIPNMDSWWRLAYPEESYRKEVIARWMGYLEKAARENSEIDGGEYRVTCRDRSVKICHIFGVIAAGKVFVMFDNITERAGAEAALRDSESRYRALVETTRTGYVIINKEGRVLDANREYVRLSGHKDLKNIVGRSVLDWTAPHEKEKYAAAVAKCAAERWISDFEIDYVDGAGNTIPVEINATVVESGRIPQILTLCRDISARRRSEEEIKALNRDLEKRVRERTADLTAANAELVTEIAQRIQAERAKEKLQEELLQSQKMDAIGRLAGGIAHDFNNILVSISGYAELLMDSLPEDSPARPDLAEILLETEHGASLTRQLMTFSNRQPLKLEELDLNVLANGAAKMLTRLIGADVHLFLELAEGLRRIKANPGQVTQVLMNLVINARDAMPDGGRIAIKTWNEEFAGARTEMRLSPPPGSYAALSIADTGCGMSAETLVHIFEPFYTTKGEGKGTGLGLSTVYGIVSRAKGGLAVESAPGKGTTITVYFPGTAARS